MTAGAHDAALWAARARTAERAVHTRHLRGLWELPGTRLGVIRWPASRRERLFAGVWHYWWQAHLLDCLLDAELRGPLPARRTTVARLVRGIRLRNITGWTNEYYDDIAWLGLALQRAAVIADMRRPAAVDAIATRLRAARTPHGGGGIWWRVGDDFQNAPATGPAAILLARTGRADDLELAVELVDWLTAALVDPGTGLVWDGLRVDGDGGVRTVEKQVYTYCQGVYLGACVELAARTGDAVWTARADRTVRAVADHLTVADGVLRGHGDGDGGLFTGILCRYLALAATRLPAGGGRPAAGSAAEPEVVNLAARLVLTSAEAAWRNRSIAVGGPLFGTDWSTPNPPPPGASRDLSVQLSGWMACEAAALLERGGPPVSGATPP